MDCGKIDRNELAARYLNGQLDDTGQTEFEIHILECERCLQAVELLQAVRLDLSERATAIRTEAPVRRGWFRWQWAVGLACVLVVVAGLSTVPALRHRAPAANNPPPVEAPQTASNHYPDSQHRTLSSTSSQNSGAGTSATRPNHAIEGNPKNDDATLAAIPANGAQNSGEQSLPNGSTESTPSTQETSSTTTAAVRPPNAGNQLSDEGEKELFRLGTVQPAPYTFSGLSPQFRLGSPIDSSGARQGGVRSAVEQRPLFKSAMRAYLDRHYDEAADLLAKDLHAEPGAADANFYLGVCELLNAKADEALVHLRTSVAAAPPPLAQPAHYYLAKAYLQTRDLASAEKELAAAAASVGHFTASAKADLATLRALRARENR